MTDAEPPENISGDTVESDREWPETLDDAPRAQCVVDRLGDRYWRKAYGDKPAFACLVRTILSQNTSDVASKPAYDALVERYGGDDLAVAIADANRRDLAEAIEPAGLYNQKATVLKTVSEAVIDRFGSADTFDDFVVSSEPASVRRYLLDLNGIGPKTADCVLLFAGGRAGVFPVDTHVHRIARRLGVAPPDADHETVREHLEAAVHPDACGFGHTSMIQFGREVCTARRPACLDGPEACPLVDLCDQIGVDTVSDEVVDPSEAD